MRVLALVSVVVIHADHWPLQDAGADRTVWSGIDLVARVAVPLFVILSGFLMTYGRQAEGDRRTFITRRLGRSVVPWVAWAPVYLLAGLFLTGEVPRNWPAIGNWLALGAGHLWFLLLVPQFYALFLVWPRSRRGLAVAAVGSLILQTALCVYRLYAPASAPLNWLFLASGFQLCFFWIGYFGLGAALGARFAGSNPRWPAWPFWMAVPAAALLLLGHDVSGAANGTFGQGTGAFLRPELPLLAFPLFLAVALSSDRLLAGRHRLRHATALLSRYSLGVYIVHEALTYVPGRMANGLLQQHLPASILGFLLMVLVTLGLAVALTRLLLATPLAVTLGGVTEPLRLRVVRSLDLAA